MNAVILTNARIIIGNHDSVIENGYVRVESGSIVEVDHGTPANSDVTCIDVGGKTILPGLIDTHVHLVWNGSDDPMARIRHQSESRVSLWAYKNALTTLDSGITTVRDLGSPGRSVLDLAATIRDGSLIGPNIVSSGPALVMTGGHIHYISTEVDGVDNIRSAARKVMKQGADLVKLMASGGIYTEGEQPGSPQFTVEELKAAVSEAHDREKKVSAHAEGLAGIQRALQAGVDTIEHGIYADEDSLRIMKENGTVLVPTMAVMVRLATDPRIPPFAQEKAKYVTVPHFEMLQNAVALGVPIATGTDAGSPCSPPDVYFQELEIMRDAGMSNEAIIRSSTSFAGETIGRPDLGVVAAGAQADLLVVDGDPLTDLSALQNQHIIMVKGQLYRNGL